MVKIFLQIVNLENIVNEINYDGGASKHKVQKNLFHFRSYARLLREIKTMLQ